MWDTFHLPVLNNSEGIFRIPLNYFILPFLVLVLSSLLFFGNSNPTLYAHHPSEFLGYAVDRNVGDAFGHVSDITISMNCRDCFISSYSMMLPSFSSDSSGLISSLSESTSSSLLPHNAHLSSCSSCCRLCSACSSAFAPGYVMAGHPNRYNLAREIANDLTHSIDILSCPAMPLSEDHSFLHPHPLGLLLIAVLSITLLVVSIISTMLTTGSRMNSIPSMLIFLAVLCVSFHSVLGYGFSEECSMYLSEDDHLVCNEVYPGRYAAECEEGYYYDQGEYSCIEDTVGECPSDMNDHQMCVKTTEDLITSDCRSAWYGDDCDQLYQVYIPDELFREKVCDYAGYDITLDPLCDVSEFEIAGISGTFHSNSSHFISFEGAQSEDDTDYWTFITTVFPFHSSDNKDAYCISNSCPLNSNPGNSPYNCDTSNPSLCPSIVLNEVYNSIDAVNEKQCAFIAKEGSAGECYTVHDDNIRAYLSDPTNGCLSSSDIESNGMISVATLRSSLSCPSSSLSLSSIVADMGISSVNSITTLQGLEYATSLTSLTLDGYDLSGDINENAEYDKLVVQILAKAVTIVTIDSGLRILSASGCGLSTISDVLDLTPIASGDSSTDKFKLTSLDLSNNIISDVSVLITESIFPNNFLTTLDISDNNICDIDNIVMMLQTHFTNTNFTINATNQSPCPCSEGADAVTIVTIDSGLRILSASGCGLSTISDVLDLTPIASGDSSTDKFKLTSLDLSNNIISDVSVLITESIFPNNFLTTLDISDNNICDIDNIVTMLQTHFTNTNFTINATNQSPCPCSEGADVSFSSHKTCRQRSDGAYQVECWNGYYLEKETNSCVEAVTSEDSIRCQVCKKKAILVPIIDIGATDVSCGCSFGFHGDSCEYVDIPDSHLRRAVCLAVVNPSAHDFFCDDLTLSDMATVTSVSSSIVDSFEGLQHAVNMTSLSIFGTSSSSVSIGNTDIGYLPLSLTDLTLEAVYLDADSDFTSFTALTTLSLNDNTEYDITESGLFPSSLTSFSANNTSLSLLFHLAASIPNVTYLSLSNNNISDPSPLYALSSNSSWISLDLSNNYICGGDDGDSAIETFLANKFSPATVNVSGQACICSSDDLGTTPLDANKVCSETKPGSNTWYVVCASDSYTSYTSAEDFSCTSPDNGDGTYGCSGGCEYGYECRYDSDLYSTSCQQVIVD
ncbi:Acidic leucine-rich nuclear phosphoprotein 32 like protein, partial [Aduncisulcus paluster]